MVNLTFLYFLAAIFQFSFNPQRKIGWLQRHLDRVYLFIPVQLFLLLIGVCCKVSLVSKQSFGHCFHRFGFVFTRPLWDRFSGKNWSDCYSVVRLFVITLWLKSISRMLLLLASNVSRSMSSDGADSILLAEIGLVASLIGCLIILFH